MTDMAGLLAHLGMTGPVWLAVPEGELRRPV
ncbi:hypothetical protein XFF7767_640044 [Xanthomonas citri pv. fuscans]|nr:hypothetical protein XFF7767_640044 [Xanthomonas citri pv. fuscans]